MLKVVKKSLTIFLRFNGIFFFFVGRWLKKSKFKKFIQNLKNSVVEIQKIQKKNYLNKITQNSKTLLKNLKITLGQNSKNTMDKI